jgi:hypothetical protein
MRRLALVALFALAACRIDRPDVKLTFDESGDHITIDAKSPLNTAAERDDVVAGRDAWSVRFKNAAPQHDRVIFDRENGEVTSVQHSATINAADVQKFFFDVPVTTTVLRGDGWVELSIYPGTSDRATRQQRDDYEHRLQGAARHVIRYFAAMRTLYAYLDRHPQRAADVFDQFGRDDDDPRPPIVTKFEAGLIRAARDRVDAVHDVDWQTLSNEAELVENPLPGIIRVRVPTQTLIVEGFERQGDDLLIRPRTLVDAVGELEGRWLSPDPLAMGLRVTKVDDVLAALANSPRHAADVVGTEEIIAALREKMRPLARYRVRFITRAAGPSS